MRWHFAARGAPGRLVVLVRGTPAGLGVGALVLAILVGSAALGARLPGLGFLPRLPGLHELDFGPDTTGRLPRLSRAFLIDALGERLLTQLLPAAEAPPRVPAHVAPSPGTTASPPPPSPRPAPRSGGILSGDWDLRPDMSADRDTVPPGGVIRYTVVVSNVGAEAFRGEFVVTAHIPFGTIDASPGPCGEPGVNPDPQHPCVQPSAPVPGSPDEDFHQVAFSMATTGEGLGAGESFVRSFSVRVNPGTPSGTRFSNHAHLDVAGEGQGTVTTRNVVVVVE